jgi:flagellar hook-basal body complex protein FliE
MNEIIIRPGSIPALDLPSHVQRPNTEGSSTAFSDVLGSAIRQVNDLQAKAGEEVQNAMTGEITDIHTAMIAVQKADVSFQMMMQVRNKLVSAYQEIMKMQV